MKHIAIIPARAGSKSILNKNLIKLDNKTSITEMAINMALNVRFFDKVILSTDIEFFIDIYERKCQVYKRPASLCEDDTLMKDVVIDVINSLPYDGLKNRQNYIWLLQPTSPFRITKDFHNIRELITREKYSSIISLRNVGSFHPSRMYTQYNDKLYPLKRNNFFNKQDLPDVFIRNGAFYVFNIGEFLEHQTFYMSPSYGYRMSNSRSINIDGPEDLLLAQEYYKKVR